MPELVVVEVNEAINPALAGPGEISYRSPPQPRDEALELVCILLGRRGQPPDGGGPWTCAIAGGRRTVRLSPGTSETDRGSDTGSSIREGLQTGGHVHDASKSSESSEEF